MRYMVFVKMTEDVGDPPAELVEAMSREMGGAFADGSMVAAGGLYPMSQSTEIRLEGGTVTTHGGPYTEVKEVVGGFSILEARPHPRRRRRERPTRHRAAPAALAGLARRGRGSPHRRTRARQLSTAARTAVAAVRRPTMQAMGSDAAAAATAVWRRESSHVIATLVRLTGDVDLAEDLAQEAMVAALAQWPEEGIPASPGAWLMSVAKRRAIDHFRRGETRRKPVEELGQTRILE